MSQQKAGHTDAGGEIHRDQVPLMYQPFVEKYFQEIRKGSGTAKAAPAAGATPAAGAPNAPAPADNSKSKAGKSK